MFKSEEPVSKTARETWGKTVSGVQRDGDRENKSRVAAIPPHKKFW
jgi:hypothetical protein